ncbi:hypothetical protein IFM89_019649 [Coptis chinensis]|uniref:Rx N-terminal domain-containing protein n=1 Tax=Coptis chinensis TaxID=261450 RepID=A0A835I3T2_9MAGN|nr:hypothetical protein IFM89_019649 [Coptis chinensis]
MAEAIVSAVIDQLASVIGKELEQEVRLVVGVRKEVKKLETKLTLIKAVLEDAEKKEIHENAVKIWLEDLKDVMYDADDVLDEWNTRILISRIEGFTADGSHVANKMCSYLLSRCACFKHGGARYDIAHRIKDIRERLAEERESWDMNTPEKIEVSGKKKEEGNVTFKAGKYARLQKDMKSEEEKKQSRVLKGYLQCGRKRVFLSMETVNVEVHYTCIRSGAISGSGSGCWGFKHTYEGCFWNIIEELFEGNLLEGTVDPGNPAILVITYQYICYKIVGASQVGTISANGDREIGELIAKAMERVGKEGVITIALTCLRTLDLSIAYYSDCGLEVLPSEVSRLFHLRYLDLSGNTRLKELPETVRSLVNLQTLKLNRCRRLRKLPEGIEELSNLRHLEVEDTDYINYYPRGGIERLSQLQTLSKFVVSDGSSKGSVIGELGNLNFLKGSLSITGLMHVKSVNEAKHAELQKKKNISTLRLYFRVSDVYGPDIGHVSSEEEIRRIEGVLENLEPHKKSLERLEIQNYVGSMLPTWMRMMSNITYLCLMYCSSLDFKPEELKPLTMLRELYIDDCPIITRRERSREKDWSILTHIPNILIDWKDIKRSRN